MEPGDERGEAPETGEVGADRVRGLEAMGRSLLPASSKENEVTKPTGSAGQ